MEMTIDDIKALIASDESRTLALKKTTGELKDGMHAARAAFRLHLSAAVGLTELVGNLAYSFVRWEETIFSKFDNLALYMFMMGHLQTKSLRHLRDMHMPLCGRGRKIWIT